MTNVTAPANWYPDPGGSGWYRFWDGAGWTPHLAPPPPLYLGRGAWGPSWKGAQIGRPAKGPGALADPGTRLGAWLLDWLVVAPVFVVLLVVTLLIVVPHLSPILPNAGAYQGDTRVPTPGIVWIYLVVFACAFATSLVMVAYQTVATAKFGRTLGKAWLHIRPVRLDLSPLGWGRSFARAGIWWLFSLLGWLGWLDPLWCLWDDQRQCLHDKVADSIVINDLVAERYVDPRAPVASPQGYGAT